ncbi:LysR family transcriptional regulator [Massilia sp. 9096]|uniref:LysR family transcriptional regulator n=1 Tax=Massilia sp. 9096 TaxID=1500894 RepID=UPI000564425D|nr:LysR family transcriptional regulator [Massilia sp. 9096]
MTLEQLRVFIEVAQRQHLTQAASALSLTPSAVSASIKALEERYGTALFHRVGRRIETSEAGRIFLTEARRTVASARAAETTLAELGTLKRGALAIYASQTIASYWLPPLLVRFRQTWPGIDLQVEMDNTESVARSVLQGTADIGFVEGDIGEIPLAKKIVGEDKLVVVVAPDHPWADGRPLGPADLTSVQWIMREAGSGTRSAFEAAFGALGIPIAELQVALSLPSNEAVRSAVMTGPFATAMSELVVAPQLEVGRLALAAFQLPTRAFSMLRHPERHRSRASLAFEQLVHSHAV